MSQKLLIHLRDAAAAAHRSTHLVVSRRAFSATSRTRPESSSVPASFASGSPFSDSPFSTESKTRSTSGVEADGDGDVLAWSGTSLTDLVGNLSDVELDVQVEVRRTEQCAAAAEVPCVVWVGSAGTSEKEGQRGMEKA